MAPKKPISIGLDEETYDRVNKCKQMLKKRNHSGGESFSKCGEFLIKKGLNIIEQNNNDLE